MTIINNQPVEKIISDSELDIHSIFPTIQGEGVFVGKPCIFIRLAGCNLQCPKCDTDYTSTREKLSVVTIGDMIAKHELKSPLVVITGGEPFRQNLKPLIDYLQAIGKHVQIETNGTIFPRWLPELVLPITIMCSPKTGSVNKKLQPYITAYKYVAGIDNLSEDGLPISALDHSAKPILFRPPQDYKGVIYLQPTDYQDGQLNQKSLQTTIDSCMKHGYTLCIQTHKVIGMD